MATRFWAVYAPSEPGPAKSVDVRGTNRDEVLKAAKAAKTKVPSGWTLSCIDTDDRKTIWTAGTEWLKIAQNYLPE